MLRRSPQPRVREDVGSGLGEEPSQALRITVLFTTVSQTLAALREAAVLAFQLRARIRILLIQSVPYPLSIDRPRVPPEFRLRQFHALWQQEPIETTIDVRLCRDARLCLADELPPHSLVLIGLPNGWWPFTPEKRLIRFLRRSGRQVISAGSDTPRDPPAVT